MSRLGIYVVYDKQNIIDRYAIYIAEELRKVTDRLIVVGIGTYEREQLDKLRYITKDVYTRDNKGYDSGAFKDAICEYVGWDEVLKYDELVISNDTFYGPFWGFKPVFHEMESQEADYWGLTLHPAIDDGEHHFPTHVQSYFLVFRDALLHDNEFRKFWDELKYPTNYDEARDFYEMAISTVFPKLGYTFATYVNEIEDNANRDVSYDRVNWRGYYATTRLHCPVMKKKRFTFDLQLSDDASKLLDYISENSEYDTSMIWENVIRNYSIQELKQGYHLHHIIEDYNKEDVSKENNKAQIVAVIDSGNDALMYLDRIGACSEDVSSLVIVSDIRFKKYMDDNYPKARTIILPIRTNLFEYILYNVDDEWLDSNYVLFITNRRKLDLKQPQCIEEITQNNVWDNLLRDKNYVTSVVRYLDKHSEVGLLVPNRDEDILGDVHELDWKTVESYRADYRKHLGISESEDATGCETFASYSFWIRTPILRQLRGRMKSEKEMDAFSSNHEKAMQITLPLFVKKCGYLPMVIENPRYAAMMRARVIQPRVEMKIEERLTEKYLGLYKVNLNHFVKRCKFLYIYGAGKIADQVTELLGECQIPFDGYVVSDGQEHDMNKNSHVIRNLSETVSLDGVGYIVAVGEKLRPEVLDILDKQGIKNIYVL